ncbi:MAG: beta-lactamase family protein [Phycisphaerae bacterium]|nr:beta-lactamase family protein [Phycisphaerae bacterium]NUQ49282.1 beta-lactamase family protein [Phycisphaerae bacterium]
MRRARLRLWLSRTFIVVSTLALLAYALLIGAILVFERAPAATGQPVPSSSERTIDPRYADAIRAARGHVQGIVEQCRIPGLSVAVAVDGRIVWSEAFGYADRERAILASPRTRFRVASVSKLFTTAAMARLYEVGRLDLDAPVQRYVPGFPDKGYPITPRQLASHRSGIRSYRDDSEALAIKHYGSVSDSLERFRDDPLAFAPDSDFHYSVYGYVLLSAMIEGAAGEDFLAGMRRLVFEPLGMNSTVPNYADRAAPEQSRFYDHVTPYSLDGSIVPSPDNDMSYKWASGGFLSTAEDLVRFGSAHVPALDQGFLAPDTLETLFRPRTTHTGLLGYGLGWMTMRDLHLRRACFHFGAGSGATSVLFVYPEQRTCFAMVANLGHAKFPFDQLMGVFNLFLGSGRLYAAGAAVLLINLICWCWHVRTRKLLRIQRAPSPNTSESP